MKPSLQERFSSLRGTKEEPTSAADHVVVVGAADGPAVVLRVVEVVPAIRRLRAGKKKKITSDGTRRSV